MLGCVFRNLWMSVYSVLVFRFTETQGSVLVFMTYRIQFATFWENVFHHFWIIKCIPSFTVFFREFWHNCKFTSTVVKRYLMGKFAIFRENMSPDNLGGCGTFSVPTFQLATYAITFVTEQWGCQTWNVGWCSSPVLTTSWCCSLLYRVVLLGQVCK